MRRRFSTFRYRIRKETAAAAGGQTDLPQVDSFKLLPLPPEHALDAGTLTYSPRSDTVSVPVFWIVLLLSVLVHVAILYFVPPLRFELRPGVDLDAPLAVELQPRREAPRRTLRSRSPRPRRGRCPG